MRTELGRNGVKTREITLYFVNGGDVPYVALSEYMPFVGETLITYDMTEYLIDFVEKDGECYMPLQTVNDLLLSRNSKLVVFTGEEVLASALSRKLLDEMYNAPKHEMSEDFALFNYNELRFVLDHFYGLKEQHHIDNFGDFLAETDLIVDLLGTDPYAFDSALRRLTMKFLDDGHSGLLKRSYMGGLADPNDLDEALATIGDMGTSTSEMVL